MPLIRTASQDKSEQEVPSSATAEDTTALISSPYRAYPLRWIVVFMFALINASNAFIWISYSPVADQFIAYYSTQESVLNWISLVYPITTVVFGLPAALFADWLGIRVVLLATASGNLLCTILRLVSSAQLLSPSNSLVLIILGSCIASLGQPLCMFSSTKLAVDWFPDRQRTTANNIASLGNAVGVLVGSVLAPVFVHKPKDIVMLDRITMGIVSFGFLMTVLLIRRSRPLTPPSVAAAILQQQKQLQNNDTRRFRRIRAFGQQFLALRTSLSVGSLTLFLVFSSGLAYFTALSSLFEQILCTKGYSNQFAGVCGALLIAGGVLASVLAAYIVDRTGLLIETTKVCFALAVLAADALSAVLWFSDQQGLIVFLVLVLGAFGFSQYSLSLELAAESTFPVPETITSGLLVVGSQLLTVPLVLGLQAVAPLVPPGVETMCGPAASPKDYTKPNMVLCGLLTLLAIVQLFVLRLPYKRREATGQLMLQLDDHDTPASLSPPGVAGSAAGSSGPGPSDP